MHLVIDITKSKWLFVCVHICCLVFALGVSDLLLTMIKVGWKDLQLNLSFNSIVFMRYDDECVHLPTLYVWFGHICVWI